MPAPAPWRMGRPLRPRGQRLVYPAIAALLAALLTASGCSSANRLSRELHLPVSLGDVAGQPLPVAGPSAATPATTANGAVPAPAAKAAAQPLTILPVEDWDIPNGHFYTQTNGQPARTSPTGYGVTNADGIPLWGEFQRLGGVQAVGYPRSPRLTYQGKVTQVFQRAVLQWNAGGKRVEALNTLLELEAAGKGDWLARTHQVPPRVAGDFDQGKGWDQVVAGRLALLAASKPLEARYKAVADPLALYGLPDSRPVDEGSHVALRTQRTVLRLWKEDQPFARAGEVTVDNAGEWAVEAGLFPAAALATEQPAALPAGLELVARTGAPTPTPAAGSASRPAPTPTGPPARAKTRTWQVANTGGDGVYLRATPRLSDKLRAWADGTLLKDLGEPGTGDGLNWHKVQAPDGTVGWVPAQYVRQYN